MLSMLQIQIIDALNYLRSNEFKMGEIAFYNALGGNQSAVEFDDIAEACRALENLGYVRDLEIDSVNVVRSICPNYTAISFREIQRLERKERWKERAIGFAVGVLTTVIGGVIVAILT